MQIRTLLAQLGMVHKGRRIMQDIFGPPGLYAVGTRRWLYLMIIGEYHEL